MPRPYAAGLPAPGTGFPGNTYVQSNTQAVALNTYQPYPYGPLPYGQINPLVPYPQYATAPLTPYGMLQPAQMKIEVTNNKDPVTITIPQQPDWVNFPSVMLDPAGAPFGSTPNTAAAYNENSSSVKPGVTFIPQVNYTFIRNFPIMPNIPPPVDLFTGTGPSGEAPYHIVGSVLSEQPGAADFDKLEKHEITGAAMKQWRLQQLLGENARRSMLFRNLQPTPEERRQQRMRDQIFQAMPQPDTPEEEGTRDASMAGWKPPVYARAGNVGRGAQRQNERVNADTARMQQLSASAYDDSINYMNSLRIKEAMRGKLPPTDPTAPRFGDSWQGSALGSMSKEVAGIAPATPGESWQGKSRSSLQSLEQMRWAVPSEMSF
jgi:hypothetical protein